MSSQREVLKENIQSAYQNKVPRQAEYANFANSVINQEGNEVNKLLLPRDLKIQYRERKAQFNRTYPITRCFPLKSRTKHGATSVTRVSVIPSMVFHQ